MKINSIIDLVEDLDTSRQTKNLNKLLIRILLHLQVEFSLYKARDYGRYGKDGEMPVCFIVNTDNTGGNSGSPVFNIKGQLVGTAFDRNYEGLTGDIAFRPSSQRAACVDIRYTLFIIDKYAGASHIIDELSIE